MSLSSRLIFRASLISDRVAGCLSRDLSQKLSCADPTSFSKLHLLRRMSTSGALQAENTEEEDGDKETTVPRASRRKQYVIHPVETSIRYLKSNAYKRAYGDQPVWTIYRRNFKGQYPPQTRQSCVRQGVISTGSPCPICRDEYLVVHHMNTALLDQFISPTTGQLLKSMKTGVCQTVQFRLELEIMKAHDFGLLQFEVPFRSYNWRHYYPQLKDSQHRDQ